MQTHCQPTADLDRHLAQQASQEALAEIHESAKLEIVDGLLNTEDGMDDVMISAGEDGLLEGIEFQLMQAYQSGNHQKLLGLTLHRCFLLQGHAAKMANEQAKKQLSA